MKLSESFLNILKYLIAYDESDKLVTLHTLQADSEDIIDKKIPTLLKDKRLNQVRDRAFATSLWFLIFNLIVITLSSFMMVLLSTSMDNLLSLSQFSYNIVQFKKALMLFKPTLILAPITCFFFYLTIIQSAVERYQKKIEKLKKQKRKITNE